MCDIEGMGCFHTSHYVEMVVDHGGQFHRPPGH